MPETAKAEVEICLEKDKIKMELPVGTSHDWYKRFIYMSPKCFDETTGVYGTHPEVISGYTTTRCREQFFVSLVKSDNYAYQLRDASEEYMLFGLDNFLSKSKRNEEIIKTSEFFNLCDIFIQNVALLTFPQDKLDNNSFLKTAESKPLKVVSCPFVDNYVEKYVNTNTYSRSSYEVVYAPVSGQTIYAYKGIYGPALVATPAHASLFYGLIRECFYLFKQKFRKHIAHLSEPTKKAFESRNRDEAMVIMNELEKIMRKVLLVSPEQMDYTGKSKFEEFYPILSPVSFDILRECHSNPSYILNLFPENNKASYMSSFCTGGFHRLGILVVNEKKKKMTAAKTTSSTARV